NPATGSSITHSQPGRSQERRCTGSFDQAQPKATAASGMATAAARKDGTRPSRKGASTKPARKPSTTEGSEAMISMVGLMMRLNFGLTKAAQYTAERKAMGTAKSSA